MLGTTNILPPYSPLLDEIARQVATTLTHDDIWEAFVVKTEKEERRLKPILVELFNEQEQEVQQTLTALPPPFARRSRESDDYVENTLFKPDEWSFRFQSAERPVVEASIESAALDALREVAQLTEATVGIDFSINNPRPQELILQKIQKFSFEVNDTTLNELKREFAEGFAAGEGIPQFSKRVEKVFGIAKKSRRDTIARTEIIGTVNRGTLLGYQESGVVQGKTWITSRDAKVRDIHVIMDKETVKLGRKFSNGLMHPGDWRGPAGEVINCRCTMTAVVKE